ncbi:uncharacterized protein LOC132047645 [Lycium ferocissimum]|uniref:uncharacterized protein LOC132047645 n=1 Tax=Lycium ferocissimum TaxID=112874 RepID=UPI0028160E8E|nr:uncharacterized protein LOC132047645 [Lycium ferocissimum]
MHQQEQVQGQGVLLKHHHQQVQGQRVLLKHQQEVWEQGGQPLVLNGLKMQQVMHLINFFASQSNVRRGRPRKTSEASSAAPVAANAPDQPAASQSNVRRGRPRKTSQASSVTAVDNERGRTTPYKRPRTVGMGIFVAENGFTTYNHGLPSSRIIDAAPRKHIRSVMFFWGPWSQSKDG